MRYRLDVVAASVADVVRFAGGWMYDRAVLLADRARAAAADPGVDTADLESALALGRASTSADGRGRRSFASDERVRRGSAGRLA
jgi:hypothetical protein